MSHFRMRNAVRFAFLGAALSLSSGCEESGSPYGTGYDFGGNNSDVVLVMGDSITAGGFSGRAPWPSRFASATGKHVVNDGIPGATSGAGSARIRSLLADIKPGFVVIGFGANDAIQGVGAGSTENHIRNMIITALNNKTIPIVGTVMPMRGDRDIYNGSVHAINERIKKIASEYNVRVVDLYYAVGSEPEQYYTDGLHLNNTGEDLVALEYVDVFNAGNPRIMPTANRTASASGKKAAEAEPHHGSS